MAVGAPWNCYLSLRAKKLHDKLNIKIPTPCENEACSDHHILRPEHTPPIISYLKANALNLFKLKANCSMLGWQKVPTGVLNANGQSKRIWLQAKCPCDLAMSLRHMADCPHL